LLFVGFVAGIVFLTTFNTVVAYTNTLDFCLSCHAMEAMAYQEYRETVHYTNASGVRAICADCHVPEPFIPKMIAKIRATYNELPRQILGTINTPEKYEARREFLAEVVWARMRANDSRECRDCHAWEAMAADAQALRAQREHAAGRQEGKTCIDCHQGIAHRLPQSMMEPEGGFTF
jgi:cytochrome c-type protein NapC